MSVVTDANLLIAFAVDDARAPAVTAQLRRWTVAGEDLHALALLPYEVANGLTRLIAAAAFPAERVAEAWEMVMALPIAYHALREDGDEVVAIATRLGRKNAYDAAYLALARRLGAEPWTFDGPLARNASGLGFPVHLIG